MLEAIYLARDGRMFTGACQCFGAASFDAVVAGTGLCQRPDTTSPRDQLEDLKPFLCSVSPYGPSRW